MKIYGYTKEGGKNLYELLEISVQADATELRQLVRFIEHCASCIEQDSDQEEWEHEHILDFCPDHVGPDVVVVRPE